MTLGGVHVLVTPFLQEAVEEWVHIGEETYKRHIANLKTKMRLYMPSNLLMQAHRQGQGVFWRTFEAQPNSVCSHWRFENVVGGCSRHESFRPLLKLGELRRLQHTNSTQLSW